MVHGKEYAVEDVSKTEMEIMLVLWEREPTTVREIAQAVYGRHSQSLHATIKSLLERLIRKNFVTCDRTAHVHLFTAAIAKQSFVQAQIDRLAENVFEGNVGSVLLSMVEQIRLSKKDRATIEDILEKIK
ncbi:MAG: BlaI/MecI/CopY family transcriptional regulator [Planctomycetales bacterium]|nr:BlaI/MecI/CopY family transcriptional regulator [Planctomycetales bacterium]